MSTDAGRVTAGEVVEVTGRLRELADRAQEHGDSVLWMVLDSSAEMLADGLAAHLEGVDDAQG